MAHLARDVLVLVGVLAVGVGPLAALIALLNRRDRRAAALLGLACGALPAVTVRSDVAVTVRCGLLRRRSRVTVDMWACSHESVWAAMVRLRRALPGEAELRIVSRLDPGRRAHVTARGGGRMAVVEV